MDNTARDLIYGFNALTSGLSDANRIAEMKRRALKEKKAEEAFAAGSSGAKDVAPEVANTPAYFQGKETARTDKSAEEEALIEQAKQEYFAKMQRGEDPGTPQDRFQAQGLGRAAQQYRIDGDNKKIIDENRRIQAGKAFDDFENNRRVYTARRQAGDNKGAVTMMAKMLNDSNNPYSAEVNDDNTLNVKFMDDEGNVKTVNKKMTMDQADQILNRFTEENFTGFHIAAMEKATEFNFKSLENMQEYRNKAGDKIYVALQRDPSNNNKLGVIAYDENGEAVDKNGKTFETPQDLAKAGFKKVSKEQKAGEAEMAKFRRDYAKDVAEQDRDLWEKTFEEEYNRLVKGDEKNFVDALPSDEAAKKAREYADKAVRMAQKPKGRKPLTNFDRAKLDEISGTSQNTTLPHSAR